MICQWSVFFISICLEQFVHDAQYYLYSREVLDNPEHHTLICAIKYK